MLTPQQAAQKWSRNLASSGESIREGVQDVTQSPTAKAADRAEAYVAGVTRNVDKWQRGLKKVSLEDWKQAMLTKGLPRIAAGASAGEPKMLSFLDSFLPYVAAGKKDLERMPRGDLQTNIARAVAMMEHNAKFKNNR